MKHVAFFGDGEQTFALTPDLILELQRKTGAGIGALCQRVFRSQFELADITETIRLALIGGGKPPAEADALVRTYVDNRPISETLPIALGILNVVFFGDEAVKDGTDNG